MQRYRNFGDTLNFLLLVISDNSELATPDEMSHIDAFNEKLRENGHWVYANGMSHPSASVVIDNRDGVPKITSGPLHNTKEFAAGMWIIEAPDLETAHQLAAQGSHACNRKIEVRPFHR